MSYEPEEPRAAARERVFGRMQDQTAEGRYSILAVVLAVSVFVSTGALAFWQASTPNRVRDQLEVGVAEITDIDTYIATTAPELRQQAISNPSPTVEFSTFPIRVSVTRDELLELQDPALRDLVLQRAASIVYVQGLSAFDQTGNQNIPALSSEWFLARIIGLLTGGWHERAQVVALIGFLVVAFCGVMLFTRQGTTLGLRTCGFAVLAGAVPGFVFMAAGAYWLGHTDGGDNFVRAIAAILERFFLVPRRDYLIVATIGAFLVLLSYALPVIDHLLVSRTASQSSEREPVLGFSRRGRPLADPQEPIGLESAQEPAPDLRDIRD